MEKLKEKCAAAGLTNPFAQSLLADLRCGLCGWHPDWLQRFKTMKVFMVCYILLGIFHGMYSSYISVMIPSIERRFGFTSKEVGTFRAMSDVSRIFASLLVAHYGGAGHRPRWIAGGAILLGIGMIVMAAPEVIFPATSNSLVTHVVSSAQDANEQFCGRTASMNRSSLTHSNRTDSCASSAATQDRPLYPLIVFGLSEFIMGLGATSIVILALPFIDDNVTTRNTPIYFALSMCGRLFGPLLGFGLGAICSSVFFDFTKPNFPQNDPRWVGAWYVGLLVCSCGILFFGTSLAFFPSVIRECSDDSKNCKEFDAKRRQSMVRRNTTFKDFLPNLKRIFTNFPFMVKLISQLMEGLVISGYLSFMQKFIKEQYRVSQSTASLATGIPGVFMAFIGIFVGGIIIKKYNLQPGPVSLLTAMSAIIGSASYFIVVAFGCEKLEISGIDDVVNPYNITGNNDYCFNRMECGCPNGQFSPVCDLNTQKSYLSACVAGCRFAAKVNGTKIYTDCACVSNGTSIFDEIAGNLSNIGPPSRVVPGLCQEPCVNFAPYVIVMCLAKLFLGIPISGIVMMQFRLVDYDLKSLANGVTSVTMSLFAFLPAPIIAGAIIDTACRYWQQTACGQKGSCLLYSPQDFRWKLHITVAFFKLITCCMDLWIAWLVWDMRFDREATTEPPHPVVLQPAVSVTTLSTDTTSETGDTTASEKDEKDDYFEVNLPAARRFTNPRKSIVDTITNNLNAKNLAEEDEDTEFVPTIIGDARRSSLLY